MKRLRRSIVVLLICTASPSWAAPYECLFSRDSETKSFNFEPGIEEGSAEFNLAAMQVNASCSFLKPVSQCSISKASLFTSKVIAFFNLEPGQKDGNTSVEYQGFDFVLECSLN